MKIERFNIDEKPDHGRPSVLSIADKAGELAVHVQRDDGSLWLFAHGPRGGERGRVVFPTRSASALGVWILGGCRGAAPSTSGVLWLDQRDGERWRTAVVAEDALRRRKFRLPLDEAGLGELLTCLRSWAETMVKVPVA